MQNKEQLYPKYIGETYPNVDYHDGQLRHALGASNYQVTRANRYNPADCEDVGWTYNHAADLTYFEGQFYLHYLSVPAYEHISPGQSYLVSSKDGIHWEKPRVSFPPYQIPAGEYTDASGKSHIIADGIYAVMHQRMAFYQAEGRLLVLGFYGHSDCPEQNPFYYNGIGRVVREVYRDGSFSPVYFIRYNAWAGWKESDLLYPMYHTSPDAGFVAACEALLHDPLAVQQWIDEHGDDEPLLRIKNNWAHEAFCSYHLDDGSVVGLFKWSMVCRSFDNGESWNGPEYEPTLLQPGSKIWGQRTPDGRYALVWNPTHSQNCRWPLAVASSDDGLNFDDMLCIHGDMPDQRYLGFWKSYGAQYMRGISERQQTPEDDAFWMSYSINKEDIWVTRVPVPVTGVQKEHVDETFQSQTPDSFVEGWNIYSPRRCPVTVKQYGEKRYLELRDSDSADYARAMRIVKESEKLFVQTRLQLNRCDEGELYLEITDGKGQIAAGLWFDPQQRLRVLHGACPEEVLFEFEVGLWYDIALQVDCEQQRFSVSINGQESGHTWRFNYPCRAVERVVYRTGARRRWPHLDCDPDSAGFVQDVDPIKDKEYLETIVLVESLKTAQGETVLRDFARHDR